MPEVRVHIDAREALDILVSVLAIALALTFATSGLNVTSADFISLIVTFTLTIGAGFVLHELAHKVVANKYGCYAAFQAWPAGLVFMLGLAIVPQLLGWGSVGLFLAPGAVYITPFLKRITPKENGVISIAGPLTNICLAFLFFVIYLLFPGNQTAEIVGSLGAYANLFLAFFNMLPLYPLDGSKVIAWSMPAWLAVSGFAFISLLVLGFPVAGLIDLLIIAFLFSLLFRSMRLF
jgi:Zn-dependent protease